MIRLIKGLKDARRMLLKSRKSLNQVNHGSDK
jgi:hypothetical protein